MKKSFILTGVVACALFAPSLTSQCASLTVTGTANPGQTLTLTLTGAGAGDPVFAVVGAETGPTTLGFGPFGTLLLGIAQPFSVLGFGTTDGTGSLVWSASLPANAPPPPSADALVQLVAVDVVVGPGLPQLTFCTSNVASFHAGP